MVTKRKEVLTIVKSSRVEVAKLREQRQSESRLGDEGKSQVMTIPKTEVINGRVKRKGERRQVGKHK